ncbi:MAG TPA: ABC transporter permease [Verrucomicrobiae bacterium]|nr:ABC transporter permease [Verrucomicrobiae bacterium]
MTMSQAKSNWSWSWLRRLEALLVIVLVSELFIFAQTGTNFATQENMFETIKLSVEIGLLALVMTPVILTGGIDLSVGSLLALCAVGFGKFWRDAGLSWPLAGVLTLGLGAMGGGLNALLITRLRLPPLIVTLGTFSLFRGLAEAITEGVDNFTGFPPDFLAFGQGYYAGVIPAQVPIFLVVAVMVWLLVHRTTFGRSFRAIGFSPEGARYAGLPVRQRVAVAYLLSGVVTALAAMIYVARVGQAKADAGAGYELLAITAVVLGGTSIFGGVGTVTGTLLGVAALALLKNGLQLSDQPSELAGILTGGLLLLALAGEAAMKKISARRGRLATLGTSRGQSG